MFYRGHHLAVRDPVAAELVRDQHLRHPSLGLDQLAEEPSGCLRVSA